MFKPDLPIRMFWRISIKTGSLCLWTTVNSKELNLQRSHASLWKQNVACPSLPLSFLLTGGSWRKSPQRISWIPPNGLSLHLTTRAIYSSFCKENCTHLTLSLKISKTHNTALALETKDLRQRNVHQPYWFHQWWVLCIFATAELHEVF